MFWVFLLRKITRVFLFYPEYIYKKRNSDFESPREEECIPLLPTTDSNKLLLETNKEGTRMRFKSPHGSF